MGVSTRSHYAIFNIFELPGLMHKNVIDTKISFGDILRQLPGKIKKLQDAFWMMMYTPTKCECICF